MNSGLPPEAWAIRWRSSGATRAPISSSTWSSGSGSSRRATGHVARRSASSGLAMQRRRSGEPEASSPTCSTRSRRSPPHWMSSKTTTSGASLPRAACGRPRRSPPPTRRPRARRVARGSPSRQLVGRERVELLDHLDHRAAGDPPRRQAAALDDARVDGGERLGDEPRLAHSGPPTIVTGSQPCSASARCQASWTARAPARARRSGPRAARAGASCTESSRKAGTAPPSPSARATPAPRPRPCSAPVRVSALLSVPRPAARPAASGRRR